MTEQEYELLQRKRETIKRYTMERNNQLNRDALHLKREQALNSYSALISLKLMRN